MTVKIIHDRSVCIGCGACAAVCPDYWEMEGDGKSRLRGAKDAGNDQHVLELPEEKCNMDAAQSCPVSCIHIEKNGKRGI